MSNRYFQDFLFGGSTKFEIEFDPIPHRKPKALSLGGDTISHLPVFGAQEPINGVVRVHGKKKVAHEGVSICLKGIIGACICLVHDAAGQVPAARATPAGVAATHSITLDAFARTTLAGAFRLPSTELYYDRGNFYEFFTETHELAPATQTLSGGDELRFTFERNERPYESFSGINVRCRYFVVVSTRKGFSGSSGQESEVLIHRCAPCPSPNPPIHMEVGIEDCLHIQFTYNKESLHLHDMLEGEVRFLLVRIKLKHMELAIIRRERAGTDSHVYNESDTLTKFEIMDGAPVRGEIVPIRMLLSGLDLTPTFVNVGNRFSVRYYVNLVLVDEEDRRYFKQHELQLYRQDV